MKISKLLLGYLLASPIGAQNLNQADLFLAAEGRVILDTVEETAEEIELVEDQIVFANGNTFHGKLLSMGEQGVSLTTAHSPDTLNFESHSFSQLNFASSELPPEYPASEKVFLINGDTLPGSLTALNDDALTLQGMINDSLVIDRKFVDKMRVNIHPQRLVYRGPAPLSDWEQLAGDHWSLEPDGALSLQDSGSIYQEVGMTEQSILRFRVTWREDPQVRLYFCDDGEADSSPETANLPTDRYYIDINSGGLQIKRESSNGDDRWTTLVNLSDNIEAFENKNLYVEIRCNRTLGTLTLYLNHILIREVTDEQPRTKGNGIRIETTHSMELPTILSNLEVHTWDAADEAHSLEKEPSGESDTLIDLAGKRMSGTIRKLVDAEEEGERHFLFDSPYSAEPIEIPHERSSLIFFQDPPEEEPANGPEPHLVLELENQGQLTVNELSFTEDSLHVSHPLLGELQIAREALRKVVALNPPLEP
ncbi:MAG: hypothetical protein Q7Q71_01820 [Verrucomicrobiota bacterium JB023]|nr:hypothetical protein [Verrucomicrobiota bacterium JB023]